MQFLALAADSVPSKLASWTPRATAAEDGIIVDKRAAPTAPWTKADRLSRSGDDAAASWVWLALMGVGPCMPDEKAWEEPANAATKSATEKMVLIILK